MARLAPCLVRARAVIDARWPEHDRTMDGWIGDAAHQARRSDHNPNARGVVDAIDVDMWGGNTPVHRPSVVAGLICHPATNYVIFNRRIFQRSDRFRPRVYSGINPHDKHCHCSITQSVTAENDPTPWSLLAGFPAWPTLRKGSTGRAAYELQAYLNAWGASLVCDAVIGQHSDGAIRAFQLAHNVPNSIIVVDGRRQGDGIVGPKTRAALFG
jgi:hypothetical protein